MAKTMDGKHVVVFGATGNVGHGAAEAFAEAGATVIAPTRTGGLNTPRMISTSVLGSGETPAASNSAGGVTTSS
mgnify:CR=1 FL=1